MIWICFAIVLGVVGLDQLTKWLVILNIPEGTSVPLIKDVLHLSHIRNYNMIFGWDITPLTRWIVIVVSIIGVAAIIFYLLKFKPKQWYIFVPLSMIAGGGIGNVIDRLFYGDVIGGGGVVDFIDFCAFPNLWKWIFNVADIFVCVGAFAMLAYLVVDIINDYKKDKKDA